MGMFDYVKCEVKLPDGFEELQDDLFQTKDLDEEGWTGSMTRHIITKEGIIMKDVGKREWVEEPGMKFGGGYFERVTDEWQALYNFHGDVRFYTTIKAGEEWRETRSGEKYKGWVHEFVEFKARFTDGKLTRIDVITDERGTKVAKSE